MEKSGRKRRRVDKCHPTDNVISSEDSMRVTADQLRELWRHDNDCGRKFMKGFPLQTCSVDGAQSGNLNNTDELGITMQEMVLIKSSILDMWKQAASLFEIFTNRNNQKGYCLRVRKDLAANVFIKQQNPLSLGWVAQIPADLSTAHIFKRSLVEPGGYLGGPISYMNWRSTNHQKLCVVQSNTQSITKVYTTGNVSAGTELWGNFHRKNIPKSEWFKDECCHDSTVNPADHKRHEVHESLRPYCFKELCVLCGFEYSIENKENRAQRKPHLAGLHADFLGSLWDGIGFYDQQEVDPDVLLRKVDELNQLLGALKQLNWNILPACKVFSQEELVSFADDKESLQDEFLRRREILKKGGTLVLRGTVVPSTWEHFKPLEPRQWKVITWKNNVKPPAGRYGVSSDVREANELRIQELISILFENEL